MNHDVVLPFIGGLILVAGLSYFLFVYLRRKGSPARSQPPGSMPPMRDDENRPPRGPNSTDPEMQELLRVNKDRIEVIRQARAKWLVEAVLYKYQQALPRAQVLPFPVIIDQPIWMFDMALVTSMLRQKGWQANHAPASDGIRFKITPDAWVEPRPENETATALEPSPGRDLPPPPIQRDGNLQ